MNQAGAASLADTTVNSLRVINVNWVKRMSGVLTEETTGAASSSHRRMTGMADTLMHSSRVSLRAPSSKSCLRQDGVGPGPV